jgi:integrase
MVYTAARNGRYTAYYLDALGRRRSAGTFDTEGEALIRAADAERNPGTPTHGVASQRYADYIEAWFLTDSVLPVTMNGYETHLRKHVLPLIGHMPVGAITIHTVKGALADIRSKGASSHTVAQCKAAIGSSFKPLVPTVVLANPTHGIKIPIPPSKPFDLVDEETFGAILANLPTQGSRLFALFLVATGTRFGEASEVRVRDFNFRTNEVAIVRRASQVGSRRNRGSRYAVVEGTKGGISRGRYLPVPAEVATMIEDWVRGLSADSLVFPKDRVLSNARARRSATNVTGHLPNDRWRKVWRKAIEAAGLDWYPRTHDLRHAYATNLVAEGVSLPETKDLLGHANIITTMKYQHAVDRQRSKASKAVSDFIRKANHGTP